MNALHWSKASVGYGGVPVLTDVDLDLPAGSTMALVGPNGAGKSTLIKSMLGQSEVLAGTAEVFGRRPIESRDQCGYVPQERELDPEFPISAVQVVLMGRYRRRGWWRPTSAADRRAATEALDRVGLADRARVRFGLLSGGQRQRVLVARALVAEPRMLLLDEPFNGVDVVSQEALLGILRGLEETTIVLSTHDLDLAREVADLVCLVNGRQWAFGPPSEVLDARPLHLAYGNSG